MLEPAITPRARHTLAAILATAALACLTVFGLAEMHRSDTHRLRHSRDNAFSMWQPLFDLGCASPNEHGTFIAGKLLPDEHGDPYIFGCDGMTINGRSIR
jgi:hypothetical protein